MRKLASIQRIKKLVPIENSDNIEAATVLGWQVVVKKGEFKEGDLCIFFEVDSVLPETAPWAEFLKKNKYRVKTCRLRGALSQGLALPISILPEGLRVREIGLGVREIGDDVTDLLGVKKYEIEVPAQLQGMIAGKFPHYVPKTDEIRVQSVPEVLEEIRGKEFYCSVKCDGTSGTYAKHENELVVCSRNWSYNKESDNSYWKIAEKYRMDEVLDEGYAVQGEVCGPGIQKNRLGLKEVDLFVFNVYNIKERKYLDFQDFIEFCGKRNLQAVPIEIVVTGESVCDFDVTIENLLELAKGTYAGTTNRREGIVVRPLRECYSPALEGRMSFKVLNNEYLLKDEK